MSHKNLMADNSHGKETTPQEITNEEKIQNLRLTSRENQNLQEKPGVCRRLHFGSDSEIDLGITTSLLNQNLEQKMQRATEKWNFDFENEVPLQGQWEWQKVPVQSPEVKEIVCSMEKNDEENRTM